MTALHCQPVYATLAVVAGLVPGDVVLLTGGDRVPADVRILASSNFRVENSSLTGESALVALQAKPQSETPTESRNVAFMSSMAMMGTAVGVVLRTGGGTGWALLYYDLFELIIRS